jgi:very-short-patch-repair endonuclease
VNVWLAGLGLEVDLLWREAALVVELDGRRYHAHRRRADAERDARLRAAGFDVRRYGWGDVVSDWMSSDVAARLAK